MKNLTVLFLSVLFLTVSATTIFAGKRVDYGWSNDIYEYEILSGEVTSLDLNKSSIKLDDRHVNFDNETEFYKGNIDTDTNLEKFVGGTEPSAKDKLEVTNMKKGNRLKCRFSRNDDGTILLNKCLVGS